MSPIDYLRGVVMRDRLRAELAALPPPPRDIPWTNPVRTAGACTHDVIYSECSCEHTNISAQTNVADFHPEQHR